MCNLSTNLYASLWFWTKDAPRAEMVASTIAMLVSHDTTTKGVCGSMIYFFLLIPSPSRNGRKRTCMEKGINLNVSTINLNDCENS